jgi:predicted RNase H-like HicB family nuclease
VEKSGVPKREISDGDTHLLVAFQIRYWQNHRMDQNYTVILNRTQDGWWIANVPILHATAQGQTRSTALKRAKSLIRFALDTIQQEGSKPPVENRSNLEVIRVRAAL